MQKHSLLPSKPGLRCLYTTKALESCACKPSWSRANNPSGLSRSHGGRSQKPKFHNDFNTAEQDKDSWAFASPVNTSYPLMLQLGGLLPQMTPGHQVPNIQLGRLEQRNDSFLLKETTPNWHNRASNLEPFDYQADALVIWLCCLSRTHTDTH